MPENCQRTPIVVDLEDLRLLLQWTETLIDSTNSPDSVVDAIDHLSNAIYGQGEEAVRDALNCPDCNTMFFCQKHGG